MEIESFNEKCDRILNYLKDKPSKYVQTLSWEQFTKDTGVKKIDPEINYLIKLEYIDSRTVSIHIEPAGFEFISNNSFVKIQQDKETSSILNWYNQQDAKQRFDDYPTVKKQRNNSYIFSGVLLLITLASLLIALQQYLKCK